MNKWTKLSIEYANKRSYLDDLFQVYPTVPEGIRTIDESIWNKVEKAYSIQDDITLIKELLKLDLFPVKDSYIAYLRKDKAAIERNPKTIKRICSLIYKIGIDELYKRCTEPKEANRQIGPMFRDWLMSKSLGVDTVDMESFIANRENAILETDYKNTIDFAKTHLNYNRPKKPDLIAKFNNKYAIGEAKFITDSGGHQNAQFEDAIALIEEKNVNAVQIAIFDGVLYIPGKTKMYRYITNEYSEVNIMSALVSREFLYQL